MGKPTILNKDQQKFLEFVLKEPYIKKMIILAKTKFDWHIDPIQLGKTFLQVRDLHDVPKMLVPFDRNKMESFFLDLAEDLKKDIFK